MKKIKFFISIVISALLFSLLLNVSAAPIYTASFILDTDSDKNEIIYVNVNETVKVSLGVNTSEGYYAGPLAVPVFYTDSVLEAGSANLNISGRFYNCCKTYTSVVNSEKLTAEAAEALYPSDWSSQQKNANKAIYTVMIPNKTDSDNTPDKLDEYLWTAEFKVRDAVGSQGNVFIPNECIRTEKNIDGSVYLARYSDGSDLSSKRFDYGMDMELDVSKAEITFQVTDLADVDNDKLISSADALLILKNSVDLAELDSDALLRADINQDNSVDSADAFCALKVSTGIDKINKYMH